MHTAHALAIFAGCLLGLTMGDALSDQGTPPPPETEPVQLCYAYSVTLHVCDRHGPARFESMTIPRDDFRSLGVTLGDPCGLVPADDPCSQSPYIYSPCLDAWVRLVTAHLIRVPCTDIDPICLPDPESPEYCAIQCSAPCGQCPTCAPYG